MLTQGLPVLYASSHCQRGGGPVFMQVRTETSETCRSQLVINVVCVCVCVCVRHREIVLSLCSFTKEY